MLKIYLTILYIIVLLFLWIYVLFVSYMYMSSIALKKMTTGATSIRKVVGCVCFTSRHLTTTSYLQKNMPTQFKGKKSSHEWVTRQLNDPYVKRAREENWRCRSAFKLIEIDDRFNILKPGGIVIDCGAAPGSWSQVAAQRIQSQKTSTGIIQ